MRGAIDQRALKTAGLARSLARHSPRAHLAGLRERLRGLSGRLARVRPLLIERPRRSAEAVSRTFVREAALLARRRGEQSAALTRLAARMIRADDERLQARRAQLFSVGQLLGAMSYRGVLSRGFALVRDETKSLYGARRTSGRRSAWRSSSPTEVFATAVAGRAPHDYSSQ